MTDDTDTPHAAITRGIERALRDLGADLTGCTPDLLTGHVIRELQAEESAPSLHCCICLYTRTGTAESAVTVIRGYAVCEDHMGYVAQGTEWHAIYSTAREESP